MGFDSTTDDRQHFVLCEISHELKRIADALERMATPLLTLPPIPYTPPYQPYIVPTSPTNAPPSLPTFTCCSDTVPARGCSGDPA